MRTCSSAWKKTLLCGIIGATGIGVVLWGLVHLFPEQIVGFFGIEDDSLLGFTVFALKVQLAMLPFVGFQIVGSNDFQATGQPAKSIFLSLTRQILFLIPLFLVLPLVLPGWFPAVHEFGCAVFRHAFGGLPGHLHHGGVHPS